MGVLCPSQAVVAFPSLKLANAGSLDSSPARSTTCRCCDRSRLGHQAAESLSMQGLKLGVSRKRQAHRRRERGSSKTFVGMQAAKKVVEIQELSLRAVLETAVGDVLDSAKSEPVVGIIMGSDSDLPVMKSAAEILRSFGILYELTVVSAHRTPERMVKYAQTAHQRGLRVLIAGAGGAAHLPGMVASLTPLPVIGVPVKGSATDGLDSLLSIVQMPRGIPVATVAIQNATNAGLLAVRMLGLTSPELVEKMVNYQNSLKEMVLDKAERLEQLGWEQYLKQ